MSIYPKISIIIPVYNQEFYIGDCIDSILVQSFTDYEVILIDDGSTDNSFKICSDYAAKDSRIHVLHKSNGGVSSARNLGLEEANGEWITFIDSDDWVNSDYLNNLYKNSKDSDLVVNRFVIDGIQKPDWHCISYIGNISTPSFLNEFNYDFVHSNICTIWCKLFKASIISTNSIKFNEFISYAEDNLFVIQYIFYTNRICFIENEDYHYRREETGLSSKFDFKGFLPLVEEVEKISEKYIKRYSISPSQFHPHNIPAGLCFYYIRYLTHNFSWRSREKIIMDFLAHPLIMFHLNYATTQMYGKKVIFTKFILKTKNKVIINIMLSFFKLIGKNPM